MSWSSETHTDFFWGAGGRAGSENDTLLPMTMTCDRLKFWNGPAWRSKIIIRKSLYFVSLEYLKVPNYDFLPHLIFSLCHLEIF